MNPGDSGWWWEHGLDGIVGALLGGLMAAGAVWLTLRHERRMADLTSTRTLAAQVAGQTRAMKELAKTRRWGPLDAAGVVEYVQLLKELEARLGGRWLHASLVVSIALFEIEEILEDPTATDHDLEFIATGMGRFCHEWIGDPTYFEDVWYLRAIHWRPYLKGPSDGFDRRNRWLFGFSDGDFDTPIDDRISEAERA